MRELIESGKASATSRDDQNITPLHWAAINAQVAACRYLLEQGAEVDALGGDLIATPMQWASRNGALILEEDIDGELRYGNMNVPSLMSLDRSERVILLGGFGVSLGPWLDIAYLVLPRWLRGWPGKG